MLTRLFMLDDRVPRPPSDLPTGFPHRSLRIQNCISPCVIRFPIFRCSELTTNRTADRYNLPDRSNCGTITVKMSGMIVALEQCATLRIVSKNFVPSMHR